MTGIVVNEKIEQEDVPQLEEVFYQSWLNSYPNESLGILREDIEELFKNRHNQEYLSKRLKSFESIPSNELFLLAKKDGIVIGLCRLVIREQYNQLQSIYILPEYQNKGIGKRFWARALSFFQPNKDTIVHVATYNQQAIAFYKKLGFVDTGKRFEETRHRMPVSNVLIPEMEMKYST